MLPMRSRSFRERDPSHSTLAELVARPMPEAAPRSRRFQSSRDRELRRSASRAAAAWPPKKPHEPRDSPTFFGRETAAHTPARHVADKPSPASYHHSALPHTGLPLGLPPH